MSHHGDQSRDLEATNEKCKKLLEEAGIKLGPTGRFPDGKIAPDDEGEIQVKIGHQPGRVIMDFGKSVKWIGFTPMQAHEIGVFLLKCAEEAQLAVPPNKG